MGWLFSNLHIAQTRTYIHMYILSASLILTVSQWYSHALYSQPFYSWFTTNKARSWNKQAFYHCSLINTIHLRCQARSPSLGQNDCEQCPAPNTYAWIHRRYDHTIACYIHHTEITTPILNWDTTPHIINRDSFRESFIGFSCEGDQKLIFPLVLFR